MTFLIDIDKTNGFNFYNFSNFFKFLFMSFNPLSRVDERLNPRRNIVLHAVSRIPAVLPREDGTLQVGHHCEMAPVLRADAGYGVIGAVRVAGILRIVVFRHNVVLVFALRQVELALSVGNPDAKAAA